MSSVIECSSSKPVARQMNLNSSGGTAVSHRDTLSLLGDGGNSC